MIFDTTAGSALHILPRILERLGFAEFIPAVHYVGAIFLTFLPLVIVGLFGSLSMTIRSEETLRMPFFYDAPTICMYVVSLPCLLMMTATDDRLLNRALNRVQTDGIVTISKTNGSDLPKRWCDVFRITNLSAQALGVTVGGIVAVATFWTATSVPTRSWPAPDGHMLPNGYVFLYCNFLFALVTTIYICRSFVMGFLLRDIVAHAELQMLPLHPDKAGGLRPIGQLGLRNEYAIAVLGLNIGLAFLVSIFFLKSYDLMAFIVTATICYLIVGPLAFVWPLLPFRDGMMRNKAELMNSVALGMRVKLDELSSRFPSGAFSAEDEQSIERLRKLGAVFDDIPVWPFDTVTQRKFFTAYIIPTIGSLGVSISAVIKVILEHFHISWS